MNYLGNIIKHYRKRLGITQKELAGSFCSVKYVFLIEKGERTPSTELMRKFSDKLGVDLFSISQYLECKDPMEAYETILLFEKYRRKSDYAGLRNLTELTKINNDFNRAPLKREIEINEYLYLIFVEGRIYEAVSDLENIVADMKKTNGLDKHAVQMYDLLAVGYLMLGKVRNSQNSIESAIRLIDHKRSIPQHKQIYITTKILGMYIDLEAERYEAVLEEGDTLLEYQKDNDLHEKIHYTLFLLAAANFKSGNKDHAMKCCLKVIYITLLEAKPYDVKMFIKNELFIELLNCADKTMVQRFCQEYDIDPDSHRIRLK